MNEASEAKQTKQQKKQMKRKKGAAWALGIIACGVLGALLTAFLAVNAFVRIHYSQFYNTAEAQFPVPGLDEGFIPQDLDYLDIADTWLFSGYVGSGPSPIYVRASDGSVKHIYVKMLDGVPYDGHGSGITSDDTRVFLTREGGMLVLNVADVLAAADGDTVQVVTDRDLDFTPAFMNIEDDMLYLGNFFRPGNYETPENHRIETPDGTVNPAVMYAYPLDADAPLGFADAPERVYSITDQIQGMCESPSGEIVLSQSYGLATSHLLAYDAEALLPVGTFVADEVDVPLYSLNSTNFTRELTTPPMSEGIEFHDDRIWVSYESASSKYFFGALYGGGQVYALSL